MRPTRLVVLLLAASVAVAAAAARGPATRLPRARAPAVRMRTAATPAAAAAEPASGPLSPFVGFFRRGAEKLSEGEPGKRGETFVGVSTGALFLAVFGDLPFVPVLRLAHIVLGPLCASAGAVLAALAVARLGDSFTPWPTPAAEGELRTDGVYKYLRHPMYVGLVLLALGAATMARSVPRLFAAAALGALLRTQALFEEARLRERHGRKWDTYSAEVPRFVPLALSSRLRWERVERLLERLLPGSSP